MIDLNDQFTRVVLIIFAALTGSCLGSFINVCIWRMPRNESIVVAPSHCTSCGKKIRFYDNIPVFSYLILGGKCRNCKKPYSSRYFWIELFCGLAGAWLGAATIYNIYPAWSLIPGMALILISTAIFFIDIKFHLVPDQLTCSGIVIGLLTRFFTPNFTPEFGVLRLGVVLATGAALWLFSIAGKRLAKEEVFGKGDIKFVMAIAALTGLKGAIPILLVASLTATLGGTIYALSKKLPLKKMQLPFGAFLAGVAIIYALFFPWINLIWS